MIKICYIIGQLTRDGAERQLYELVKGIDRERFDPVVVSLSHDGYWADEIRKLNIEVIEIPRKKNREFSRMFKLYKLLREIKPDIVNTYMFSANSYGRIAAILIRIPIIVASERNLPEIGKDKNTHQIYIDKVLALFTDAIICNSRIASETLVRKYSYNPQKVFTVKNGIRVNGYQKVKRKNDSSAKIIGTVGRLYPQKNHKLFLDVAKIVLEKINKRRIKFLIVGEGPLRSELEEYAKKLGIESNVLFTGERNDIPQLLSGMDIFVLTSLYEGLSNAIMEAMASGLPVVATNVGGNNELVQDGETGFLCPLDDVEALAKRIIELIINENEAKQKGKKGKSRILNEFTTEKMIRVTENIYIDLCKKKVFNSFNQKINFNTEPWKK
jgi:glycosyltransferase involved in cell wall biosynthesis